MRHEGILPFGRHKGRKGREGNWKERKGGKGENDGKERKV
jgi:hypothetical protein